MRGIHWLGNSCNFKDDIREWKQWKWNTQSTVPSLSGIKCWYWQELHSLGFSESLMMGTALSCNLSTCTFLCTPMLSYRDWLCDLFPSSVLSSHHCHVSAWHFSEITYQSKRMFSVYSWSLIVCVSPAEISNRQSSIFHNFTPAWQTPIQAVFSLLNKLTMR